MHCTKRRTDKTPTILLNFHQKPVASQLNKFSPGARDRSSNLPVDLGETFYPPNLTKYLLELIINEFILVLKKWYIFLVQYF